MKGNGIMQPISPFRSRAAGDVSRAAGNVMIIVLIAIALFAALSFAVVRSEDASDNIGQETTQIHAGAIMRYAAGIGTAVDTLMSNDVNLSAISFENDAVSDYDTAGGSEVFSLTDGGVTYEAPDAEWLDSIHAAKALYGQWVFPADLCVPGVGSGTTTCHTDGLPATEEMIVLLPYVREEICTLINEKKDISLCAGEPCEISNVMDSWTPDPYIGAFADGTAFLTSLGNTYNGKSEGCVKASSGGASDLRSAYIYYRVLIAR